MGVFNPVTVIECVCMCMHELLGKHHVLMPTDTHMLPWKPKKTKVCYKYQKLEGGKDFPSWFQRELWYWTCSLWSGEKASSWCLGRPISDYFLSFSMLNISPRQWSLFRCLVLEQVLTVCIQDLVYFICNSYLINIHLYIVSYNLVINFYRVGHVHFQN